MRTCDLIWCSYDRMHFCYYWHEIMVEFITIVNNLRPTVSLRHMNHACTLWHAFYIIEVMSSGLHCSMKNVFHSITAISTPSRKFEIPLILDRGYWIQRYSLLANAGQVGETTRISKKESHHNLKGYVVSTFQTHFLLIHETDNYIRALD